MQTRYRKNVGDLGEEFAAAMLENAGYRVIKRNYVTKQGEIDIIAGKDRTIHFVEVKTRTGDSCGFPAEAVTAVKQERMKRAALQFIQSRHLERYDISLDVYEITAELLENSI
jgi:putative endonuclease